MSTRPTEEAKIVITTRSRRGRLTVVRCYAALIALIATGAGALRWIGSLV
jgi:hypothetical protein